MRPDEEERLERLEEVVRRLLDREERRILLMDDLLIRVERLEEESK